MPEQGNKLGRGDEAREEAVTAVNAVFER